MTNIKKSLIELIGNTPMLELTNYNKSLNTYGKIIAKLESFNPLGSIKDRTSIAMISNAEKSGLLNSETIIIEPTSGNTGIGLAFICAAKKYKLILTMPETLSIERIHMLKALGAEIILTPASLGMKGAIQKSIDFQKDTPNSIILHQFENVSNNEIHRHTTAEEILKDTNKNIDIFVCGVGTGGTITGVGEVLKKHIPYIKIIAVEPEESSVLNGYSAGYHKIQGIGPGFIPKILNMDIIDEIHRISYLDASYHCNLVAHEEGLIVGPSSGAALKAATNLALLKENKNKNIIVIFPDTGERYLSTDLYNNKF
ncbi:MAG: cysteine synthase A [Oscillospiraceae bacterium]|nr:cysteine synthase A [Oscillospiraceae bacterium]